MAKGKFHLEEALMIRLYKQADDKKEQIKILAQLNACSKDDIIDFLESQGVDVADDISKNTKRYSIYHRKKDEELRKNHIVKQKHYTDDELEELKRLHALKMNDVEIAFAMNRSACSVRKWRTKMGLPPNAPNHWPKKGSNIS